MFTTAPLRPAALRGPVDAGAASLPTLLAASVATGQPVRLDGFRTEAVRPGLLRPDLAVVRAAASVCDAEVEGAHVGSTALSFRPGAVRPGEVNVAVGAGGSAVRVAEAVLPALCVAGGPSRLVVEGATVGGGLDVESLRLGVVPVLRRLGADATVTVQRHGFAPVGGGRLVVEVRPGPLVPVDLETRGAVTGLRLRALAAGVPLRAVRRTLGAAAVALADVCPEAAVETVEAASPGLVLFAQIETASGTVVVSVPGAPGLPATEVAARLARRVRAVLDADAPLSEAAAVALVVPVALAGGGVLRAVRLGARARWAVEAVRQTGIAVRVLDEPGGLASRVVVG